jgi:8-oxo-dGTP diphosphatase
MSKRPKTLSVARCCVSLVNGRFLIVRRALNDRYAPGAWEFPGGKIEADENVPQAIANELMQETGLTVDLVNPIAHVSSSVVEGGPYDGYLYLGLISIGKASTDKVILSSEHMDFAWITYEEASSYQLQEETREALDSLKRNGLIPA